MGLMSMQLAGLTVPAAPAWMKLTVPLGAVVPALDVSVTVAVQVDA